MYVLKPVSRLFTVDALNQALDVVRPQGFYYSGEMHDFWEAVFVVDGQVTVTANEQVVSLHAGQLLFHKPMEFHRLWSENGTAPHLQLLSFHTTGEGMRYFEDLCLELTAAEQAQFGRICTQVTRAVGLHQPGEQSAAYQTAAFESAVLIESFLLSLMDHPPAGEHALTPGEKHFREILTVLHEHCEENLSVEEIAALCGCSASNLKRIFSQYADRGVAKYFLTVKMQRAMQLLDRGMTAADVARQVGFTEVGYFHTVFHRETGKTPGEYRRLKKSAKHFIINK